MGYGKVIDVLNHVTEDLYHLAPVPFVYHQIKEDLLEKWHSELINEAKKNYSEPILEVPDVRHIKDLGKPFHFNAKTWSEDHIAAVGVWHNVPTNGYLNLKAECIFKLKNWIESRYLNALKLLNVQEKIIPWFSESWIQFYKKSDYKVLHNHERYEPPYPDYAWSGAYYIDDGDPDASMPYSGILSFRIRQTNYLIRPLPGLLVMWPSDILHEVHPFYGSRERIVINFNINAKTAS